MAIPKTGCGRYWPGYLGKKRRRAPRPRRDFLLRHHIAMWDVLASCTIHGAEDSSIREALPNDIRPLLAAAPIEAIYTTGKKAFSLYRKYLLPMTGREAVCLPSTSPANCRWETMETLTAAYHVLKARESLAVGAGDGSRKVVSYG